MTVSDPRTRQAEDIPSSTAPTQAQTLGIPASASAGPLHPALLVLYQRAPPKPLGAPPSQGAGTSASRAPLRDLWRAGGYEPLNHTRKNWREVVTAVPVTCAMQSYSRSRSKCASQSHSAASMDVVESGSCSWTTAVLESERMFVHFPPDTLVTSFGGHLPMSWG